MPSATSKMKYRLSQLELYLLFALLSGLVLAAGVVYYRNYEQRFVSEVEQQLSAIADLKTNELEQFRSERLLDASFIMRNEAFSALVQRAFADSNDISSKMLILSWLNKLEESGRYDSITLLNAHQVLKVSIPSSRTAISPTILRGASEASKSRKIVFQDFYRNEYDNKVYLAIIVPVFIEHKNSKLLGTLIMTINPETYLFPFIKRWPIPSKTAETLLVRRDGNTVVFLNNLRFDPKAALNRKASLENLKLPAARAALGYEGTMKGIDYRNVLVLAATRKVPHSPWALVARMDITEIYTPLREHLWVMLVFEVVTLLALASIIGLFLRQQRIQYYKEQYKLSEDLRESEKRFQLLFQIMSSGFALHEIILSDDGIPYDYRFLDVNPAFEEQTNLKAENIVGHTVLEVLPGTEAYWIEMYGKVALSGESIHFENYAEAIGRHYEVSAYSPKPGQFATIIADITERKSAEEQILKLNTELEQRVKDRTAQMETSNIELEAFAYSVSHDLRAPLRAIDGFSRIVMEDYANKLDAEGNRLLNIIRNNTQKMDTLITDLLMISRVTRSEMKLVLVDMTAMVNSVYTEIVSAELTEEFDVTIETLPNAYVDPVLIKQVWTNLISNAVKYTRPRDVRRIEISGRVEDGMTVYCVKDNGVGFDPEYSHKLFGVFQRLHTVQEFEGTGIGLAIVQRIVHRHGGRVWASGELNVGATFCFALPTRGDLQ